MEINYVSDNESGVVGVKQPSCATSTSSSLVTNHVSDSDVGISLAGHGATSISEQAGSHNSLPFAADNNEDIHV
ncbi:hypothetical protein V6N13_138233 [Hibiscus sabdariffa]